MYIYENAAKGGVYHCAKNYFLSFSHFWFATPQEVLQADWQEVWHSPQPPVATLFTISLVSIVLILLISITPILKASKLETAYLHSKYYHTKPLMSRIITLKNPTSHILQDALIHQSTTPLTTNFRYLLTNNVLCCTIVLVQ